MIFFSENDASDNATVPERSLPRSIARAARAMAWAVGLGALAGLIAGGLGSRIVMKLIALADPSTEGTFTDAEAIVGDFTLDGTLGLLVLGAIAGLIAGTLYLGLRRWLPVPTEWNGVAYGVVTLVTVGLFFFDSNNADFQIFEPVLLVVFLFSTLFILNGVLLARLMDRFYAEPAYAHSRRVSRAASGVLVIVCMLGAFGLVAGVIGMIEDSGTCLQAAGQGNGCAVLADP
jgi:hypothetical protein